MALTHLFRDTLLKLLIPKLPNPSACASSKNSSDDSNQEYDCKTESPEEKSPNTDDGCPPEPEVISLETPEDNQKRQLQKCKILIREPDNYCLISGVPIEVTCTRPARIFQPTKNAAQSGTRHLGQWLLDFSTKDRWENPLMGWCSSGDALSNLQMRFASKEAAIDYCKKNNMSFWVSESKTRKKPRVASYALNYHYTRRTRVSTK